MSTAPHTAVLIGRFQPFHKGHLALLQQALQAAEQVVLVLGSAWQARSPKNPLSWQERAALIAACLPPADAARLHCVPVRDYYDEPRWRQAVLAAVEPLVPEGASIALIGHFKDASSDYLAGFDGWQLLSLPRQGDFDGTPIRTLLWNLEELPAEALWARLEPQLPAPVAAWLRDWSLGPTYAALRAEWRMIHGYRQAWANAPYPPVFVTVDALLLCAGHVLLIQRAHAPGQGLWALPGGFLEPRDSLWQSCLRELQEETGLEIDALAQQVQRLGVEVFDHPDRSLRGRTVTHVHLLQWPGLELPAVLGGDDAAAARWVPLADIADLEPQMFEDHFHVLRRCFELLGAPLPTLP